MPDTKILYIIIGVLSPFLLLPIILLVLCLIPGSTGTFKGYVNYDEFDMYKNDFNIVCQAVRQEGNGTYAIVNKSENLSIMKYGELISYEDNILIELSKEEEECLKRLYDISTSTNTNREHFSFISVKNQEVFFSYEQRPCDIVYTERKIKDVISDLEQEGYQYGYIKYGDGWYGVYQ